MSSTWQTVRVFISSTFRDMHADRDHLVKVVFPPLRQWCGGPATFALHRWCRNWPLFSDNSAFSRHEDETFP